MKNKFSDDTSNIDDLPEHNQEPTESGKIKLLDVVALTQDVPEHNLKRGEVGTVVEILANGEAYEVEFSDDNGQMYKCLSFPASQLKVLHQERIKRRRNHPMSNNREFYIQNVMLENHQALKEHWESVTQTVNNTYKDQVEEVIRSIEDLHTSGEYDVYRGENREYEYLSSSMFRMMRPLIELIERFPRLVSETHTLTLSYNIDGSQEESAMRLHSMNFKEFEEHGVLPLPNHKKQLLENPDLLMEAAEKEFNLEFQSRANRIYHEFGESDIQPEIQHHFGKTRRIDMTKCPYIALFFTCYGGGNHDGRIMFFTNDELKSRGELTYPKYSDNTRFKNQESVLFIPKAGYIKPSKKNMRIIPKHLKIPILLWLDENKDISNRTMYNDTLGLIENQKILERYYDVYSKSVYLESDQSSDDWKKIIGKLNEAIDIVPVIIDIAKNVNYNWVSPENLGNIDSFNDDKQGSSYIPAPYFLYFSRACTRINKSISDGATHDGKMDKDGIKLALDDLMYARYMTQFSHFCVQFYNDQICLPEGICYLLLGELEKSKQKLSEALEISEQFGTPKDEIMFYLKQMENHGI